MDANDNGTLDTAEIINTRYICNGENGADNADGADGKDGKNANIQATAFEGNQGRCTNGGVKIDILIDGVVQTDQTQYICNGTNGVDEKDDKNTSIQTTAFEGALGNCTNGGVKIDILIDGVVQTDQTQYICNGTNGQDGQNGSDGKNASIQTTAFTGAQGTCTNGGVKVDVLIDGVIQTSQTQYICNGTNVKEGEDASCDLTQAECNAHKTVLNKAKCQCSSYFTFGHYEQDNTTTNGKELISWRILDMKDGKALVISEKALDAQPFKTTSGSITWEKSTIRSWLNGYDASENTVGKDFTINNFIDTAFTEAEKAKIVISNVKAHKNPDYSTSPGNDTTDKIFLLSITEANTYFLQDGDRKVEATPYLFVKGVSEPYGNAATIRCQALPCEVSWWLRTPGTPSTSPQPTACVDGSGSINSKGETNTSTGIAVRPALWLNL